MHGMKNHIMTAFWFCVAFVWITLGFLYLIRVHDQVKGSTFLVLGVVSIFVAFRFRKRDASRHAGH